MKKTFDKNEWYKLNRPISERRKLDEFQFPIMDAICLDEFDFENMEPLNVQNLSSKNDNSKGILLCFSYDKFLNKLWNDPLKRIIEFGGCTAVCTPDFSVYDSMNYNDIRYNIYRNRWLGCTYQDYGIRALPTISWAGKETYDICFSGIEKGGVVVISTIGCHSHKEMFLSGFEEMKKRLEPEATIVYGDMIDGMEGSFINIKYEKTFPKKYKIEKIPEEFFTNRLFDLIPKKRINEYNSIEEFNWEFSSGIRDVLNEKGPMYEGIEFRYHNKNYRLYHTPQEKEDYDDSTKPTRFFLARNDGYDKKRGYIFQTLACYQSMNELLESRIIEDRKFQDIIMDDRTQITGKD